MTDKRGRWVRTVRKLLLLVAAVLAAFAAWLVVALWSLYSQTVNAPAAKALGGEVTVLSMRVHSGLSISVVSYTVYPDGTSRQQMDAAYAHAYGVNTPGALEEIPRTAGVYTIGHDYYAGMTKLAEAHCAFWSSHGPSSAFMHDAGTVYYWNGKPYATNITGHNYRYNGDRSVVFHSNYCGGSRHMIHGSVYTALPRGSVVGYEIY